MIKNIIFDINGVILSKGSRSSINNMDLTSEEKELFVKVIFNENKYWQDLDYGYITQEEMYEKLKNKFPVEFRDKANYVINNYYKFRDYQIEILELLKKLKKNYHIYILSNYGNDAYLYFKEKMDPYIDGYCISSVEHMMKPSKEIYERLIEKFNLKKEETIFIDDVDVNVDAAKKVGIDSFKLDYNKDKDIALKEFLLSKKINI